MSIVESKCNRCGAWERDAWTTVLTAKALRWTLCSTCRDSLVRWLEEYESPPVPATPLVKEADHE